MNKKSGKRNLLLAATIVGLGLSASINPACADDLWDAINTAASAGLYTLNSDYTLPDGKSSLGDLKVGVFILEGNNHTIDMKFKKGVSIDSDKSMTIRNAIIKNARSEADGAAIYNKGKLEITGSKFNNCFEAVFDDDGVIWNEGTITTLSADFNENSAQHGGVIYNKGTISSISGNYNKNDSTYGGGAIYNKGTISSISGNFDNNKAKDGGGAIYNKDTISSISGNFNNNEAHYDGGAIYNKGTITSIYANFTGNVAKSHEPYGGAIYNDGKIGTIKGDFINNKAEGTNTADGAVTRGGAIYNGVGDNRIDTIIGNFTGNATIGTASTDMSNDRWGGGAIYNNSHIGSISGTFTENKTIKSGYHGYNSETHHGGAIFNNCDIEKINADFYRNEAYGRGGAIYNRKSRGVVNTIGPITGTFDGNIAYYHGGAIWNEGQIESISGKFINNKSQYGKGGAIWNAATWMHETFIKSINADFTNNSSFYDGGAINNNRDGVISGQKAVIKAITGNFTNNHAVGLDAHGVPQGNGGAIYNNDEIGPITGDFRGNYALLDGGAIWTNEKLTITGNFFDNYAGGNGGAIYQSDGDLIITTNDTNDITFSGNKQQVTNIHTAEGGESNAIYNNKNCIEFNVKDGRAIWMYDKLADKSNSGEWVKSGRGTLALGQDMSGILGDIHIKEGIVKLVQNDRDPSIFGTAFSKADEAKYENNVYIDSQNNHIDNFHLGNDVTLKGALHSLIDVNLADRIADKIIAGGSISGSGNIVIDSIIIITDGSSYESPRNVTIADDHTKGKISLGSGVTISGEGYTDWSLSYATSTGILNFNRNLTLKEVTNATDPASRVYNAVADVVMTDNIENIGNDNANLIVNMNGKTLSGQNNFSGFVTKAGDQILTINNAAVENFRNTGGNGSFIYDSYGAEIILNDTSLKNNTSTTGHGGAIYSNGNVTVNAVNKSVVFEGNSANSVANSIYMLGTAAAPTTLALNSKDATHTITINDGIDGNYYNTVINGAENNTGKVIFGGNSVANDLNVMAGTLENNGVLSVKSGVNNGTISGTGNFKLDDSGAGTSFDNKGSFTQNSLTIKRGEFKTNSNNLHITNDIINDGALIFNNTTNGSIGQNIKGSTPTSNGIVEIAAADGVTVDLNGKTITNNNIKLTNGIFDVTKNADNDGNINLSSMGLVANGGTLNLQDNKAGNINLGDINTGTGDDAKNLNVAIDMHFVTDTVDPDVLNEYADIISANSLTGNGKIHVSDIKMSKDEETVPVTPPSTIMSVQVATGDAAIKNMDFTGTTITNIDKTFSSILLEYDNVVTSPTGGYLKVSSETPTLEKAITSYVNVKLYSMSGNENIDDLVLHGDQLAVTTNGADILSTSGNKTKDGIFIADSLETLSFNGTLDASGNPETKISGFKTAIDNSSGGTVYLENIEMSGNTTDVLNTGIFNLAGTNKVETIADDTTEPVGSTNIVGGTSTIGSIVQKAVNILPDSELNINADKLSAKDGVDNWGTLNLGDGDLASDIFETQSDSKQSVTNIVGDVKNTSGKTIAQKSVTIANSAKLTTDADKVTADVGISNKGTLNLTGGALASDVTGTGTTNIKGDVTNLSRNIINQKSIAIDSTASLTSLAGKLVAEEGITNAGTLTLAHGELVSAVTGAGTTNIVDEVETNGNNITQTTVNIGQYGTEEEEGYLSNDAVINATNINVTTEGNLDNIGTISATTIANAGNVYIEDGTVNVTSITTDANASTIINGGSVNADNITNNGETNITGGTVVTDIIENTGGGTTTIAGGDVTVNTSITNSGTGDTDIYSVVKTPLVSATNGDINIYATNGQTATSNLLKDVAGTGLANVTTSAGSTVSVNTNSKALVIDNNVSGAGTLSLNGSAGSEFYVGPNATVSSALNIAAGQLNALNGSNITGPISVAANATLSTMNGDYSTFNNITFADGSNLKVDVNAISNQTDKFVAPVEPIGGNIFLKDLSIQDISKTGSNDTSINLSQAIGLNNLQSSNDLMANLNAKYSLTPIRRRYLNVQMTPEGLMLNIAGTGNKYKDFNPAVMASPVAAQMGGYLTQLNSYDEAFRNMDMYMLMTAQQRQALKFKNKYVAADSGLLYDSTLLRQERAEGWFRPYATFEKVPLKNGPKVENTAYGSFMGGESKMYDLGHGWDGMWGAYVGYNGSHQNYDGVSIYQNGGTLGLTGMAYKGNFFTGLTINAGASAGEASTMYGNDNFAMLMAGIASKTGYNWELANGKFIIQPSWLMSYSFVNTFDYTNAAGVRMHSSPLNAIQLQPELKFIGNLKNGWQPYASVAMVWNIMDDTKFKANDVSLPELSVKPYVKYGVGLRKIWGERFTGFFQTYLTNGGRNGVGLQAGFTWAFGGGKDKKADEQKIQKSLKKTPVLKKTEITLNDSNA